MRQWHAAAAMLTAALLSVAFFAMAHGQQIHRNSFEGQETFWVKGSADVVFRELAHEITDSTAHKGEHSEHVQISSDQGSYIYYYYPTSRAPLTARRPIFFRPNFSMPSATGHPAKAFSGSRPSATRDSGPTRCSCRRALPPPR